MDISYSEAIKRILDHIRVHHIGQYPHIKIGHALQLAVTALQEAEQRAAGCEYCAGETKLYQHTTNTKMYINTFGMARTIETACMPCPPAAKCCLRGNTARSAFIINYCPECGRKLQGGNNGKIDK